MADFSGQLVERIRDLSLIELAAMLLAIAYLVLAIRQSIWCWVCAILSTVGYIYLFIGARLYMESLLNLFYLAMAIYGWYVWRNAGGNRRELPVSRLPVVVHLRAISAVLILSATTGTILQRYTDAAYPYVDSMTTFAAIWTTFLVARKVLENWWYWLVIDAVSVAIYWSRDLPLTALLFVLYLLMIPAGMLRWNRSWQEQPA